MLSCLHRPRMTVKDKAISPPHLWHYSDHSWFISLLRPPRLCEPPPPSSPPKNSSVIIKSVFSAAFAVNYHRSQSLHAPACSLSSWGNPHINQWTIQMAHGLHHRRRTAFIRLYLPNGHSASLLLFVAATGRKKNNESARKWNILSRHNYSFNAAH